MIIIRDFRDCEKTRVNKDELDSKKKKEIKQTGKTSVSDTLLSYLSTFGSFACYPGPRYTDHELEKPRDTSYIRPYATPVCEI